MAHLLKFIFLLSFISLYSCGENGILESIGSSNSSAADGSSQWDPSHFPLNVQVSSEFTTAELQGMAEVGKTWSESHGSNDFFTFGPGESKSVSKLTDYRDGTLGIYKMHSRLPDYQDRALAITQIYADRINYAGKSYFNIKHADIVVNYADYTFSSESSFGSYDLKTVILHELGHFVGLNHFQSPGEPSIMEPSIDSFDQIHYPYPKDVELIQANYQPEETTTSAIRSIASLSTNKTESKEQNDLPKIEEEGVRIIHMLKADKSCEHYINGKLIHKH